MSQVNALASVSPPNPGAFRIKTDLPRRPGIPVGHSPPPAHEHSKRTPASAGCQPDAHSGQQPPARD